MADLNTIKRLIEKTVLDTKEGKGFDEELQIRSAVDTITAQLEWWVEWYFNVFGDEVPLNLQKVPNTLKYNVLRRAVRGYVDGVLEELDPESLGEDKVIVDTDAEQATERIVERIVRWPDWYFELAEDVFYADLAEEQASYDEVYVNSDYVETDSDDKNPLVF